MWMWMRYIHIREKGLGGKMSDQHVQHNSISQYINIFMYMGMQMIGI